MQRRAPQTYSGAPPRLLFRIEKFLESAPVLNALTNGPRMLGLVCSRAFFCARAYGGAPPPSVFMCPMRAGVSAL